MIKNGKVEIGKTPSEVSSKPCTLIKQGSPLVDGEEEQHRDVVNAISDVVLRMEGKLDACLGDDCLNEESSTNE
jgi:hypothetical protein